MCKAVRYKVSAEPLAVMDCHCRDCQYAAFHVTKGTPKRYASRADSGASVHRDICAECGSPLFSEPPGGQIIAVKAGSLDDPSWLKMTGALYTKSAQPWAPIDRSLPVFEAMPPRRG